MKTKDWIKEAKKNGISESTFLSRIYKLKWDKEKAATVPSISREDKHWVKVARRNGIPRNTYYYRVDEMLWTPEEAATIKPMSGKEKSDYAREIKSEYKEVTDKKLVNDPNNLFTLTKKHIEIAKNNGIKENTVKSRVYNRGWTVDDAISIPTHRKWFTDELKQIAIKNDISFVTVRGRVNVMGWSPEDAVSKPLIKTKPYTRKDKEWIKKAIDNGIKYSTYLNRVNNLGWSPQEAATTKPLQPGKEFLNKDTEIKAREGWKKFRKM